MHHSRLTYWHFIVILSGKTIVEKNTLINIVLEDNITEDDVSKKINKKTQIYNFADNLCFRFYDTKSIIGLGNYNINRVTKTALLLDNTWFKGNELYLLKREYKNILINLEFVIILTNKNINTKKNIGTADKFLKDYNKGVDISVNSENININL